MKDYRKLIPIINMILVAFFAYYILSWVELFRGTAEYHAIFRIMLLPIILLVIVVIISILLYWFRIGEKE